MSRKKKKSMRLGSVFLMILLTTILLSGCGEKYTCSDCGKEFTGAVYTNIDADDLLCKDCAEDYWYPLPIEKMKLSKEKISEIKKKLTGTTQGSSPAGVQQNAPVSVSAEEETEVTTTPIPTNYMIDEAMTDFSEDRAWVRYTDNNGTAHAAIIDTTNTIVKSFSSIEFNANKATDFESGISCLFDGSLSGGYYRYGSGMLVVDSDGSVLFDGFHSDDGSVYYYLGKGNGSILALQNVSGFSANEWYLCDINYQGNVAYRELCPEWFTDVLNQNMTGQKFGDNFRCYGDDIFAGIIEKNGMNDRYAVYNRATHSFFETEITIMDSFENGVSVCEKNGQMYIIHSDMLRDEAQWQSCHYYTDGGIPELTLDELPFHWDGSIYSNHMFIYMRTEGYYSRNGSVIALNKGVYDMYGNLLASFPEEWNIQDAGGFCGGYAPIFLLGADNNDYVTVVDTNGQQQFEPIRIDGYTLPSWHGYTSVVKDRVDYIMTPQGALITQQELNTLMDEYIIGRMTMRCGKQRVSSGSKNDIFAADYDAYQDLEGYVQRSVFELTE